MIHRPIKLEMKEQGELEKLWKSTKHWPHWVWWWDISFENNLNNLKITLNRGIKLEQKEQGELGKLWKSIELWPIRFGGEIFLWLLEDDLETFTVQSNWRWRSATDWRSVAVTEGLNIYIDCMGPLCMSSIVSGNLSQSSWFSHHYLMNGIELSDRRRRYYYSLACTTRYLTNGM